MTLTEGDKAICAEIAREIIEKVLLEHIKSCPHGKSLLMNKVLVIGLCIGSGVGGGSIGALFSKLLTQ